MFIYDINIMSPDIVSKVCNLSLQELRNFFVFPHRLANGDFITSDEV